MRVELGGDHWAELKDPEAVTNGERRKALNYFFANDDAARDMVLYDGWLIVAVEKWSLELPLPSEDAAVLDRLTVDQANRLYGAAHDYERFTKPDFAPSSDPKAGTGSLPD